MRVAVVGIGCRLRGVIAADGLYAALAARRQPFAPAPADRWDTSVLGPAPASALLDDYRADSRVLRIPPAQLERMHRMERATLAAMQGALLDAGLTRLGAWGARTSVHLGASTFGLDPAVDHIARLHMSTTRAALDEALGELPAEVRALAGYAVEQAAPPLSVDSLMTIPEMTAGRVANAFDLGGGHLAYDAGPASALAALGGGLQALAAGESDLALVAAASPLVTSTQLLAHQRRGWLAGPCGVGAVLGEGVVALLLAREDDARAERRRIYALVRGVGHAAAGRRGTRGSLAAQIGEAAQRACDEAGLPAAAVSYVEAQRAGLFGIDDAEQEGLTTTYGAAPVLDAASAFGWLQAGGGLLGCAAGVLALQRGSRPQPDGGHALSVNSLVAVSTPGVGAVGYQALISHADEPTPAPRRARGRTRLAIVGVGAAMPGAADADALFRGVVEGHDAVRPIERARWNADALLPRLPNGGARPALGGQLPPLALDAARLRVAPAALPYLDGATALTVEVCAQALADAGFQPGAAPRDRVGVVVGSVAVRAGELGAERAALAARTAGVARRVLDEAGVPPDRRDAALGRFVEALARGVQPLSEDSLDTLSSLPCASRVAALFDFRGEVLAVDGACAASIAAVHTAARALDRGQIDVAVVAGAAYNLVPEYYAMLATMGALSSTGSRPFDAAADGMVPAEGAGALVLKRLADAERDGDRIYAVVAGSALSSDGRGTAVLAPNTLGQQRAFHAACAAAGVTATDIDLLEAHGTGTVAGDAVELETYASVFAERPPRRPVVLGSIKSNIGHLSSAAGVAGLIKAALALHRRVLPPMRHPGSFTPAQAEKLERGQLRILQRAEAWPAPPGGAPRRASVASVGLGGVNGSVVLEERPAAADRRRDVAQRLIVELVAKSRPSGTHAIVGPLLLVADPERRVLEPLRQALAARAVEAVVWSPSDGDGLAALETQLTELVRRQPVAGVIDLGALKVANASPRVDDAAAIHTVRRLSASARVLQERLAAGGLYAVVTGMGGGLGFASDGAVESGGAAAGFVKALKQELPAARARLVDFDAATETSAIVASLLGELDCGDDRLEVGYRDRRRVVPVLRQVRPVSAVPTPLEGGGVVVVSGGARGVVFGCARALARAGIATIVTGRHQRPPRDTLGAELADDEFEALRRTELVRQRRADSSLTPVRFARQWATLANARGIARNLAAAEAAGESITYAACDVTDAEAVTRLVAGAVARHGRLRGLVHGAMIEQSRALAAKEAALVDATVAVKMTGLANLLATADEHAPEFVVAFGSIAGRFGNRGQTDYAAANDAMARTLARWARRRPRCRATTLEWTAWAELGAAAEPEVAARLADAGVVPIDAAEGVRWFVRAITEDGPPVVAICAERTALDWPHQRPALETAAGGALDDDGRPLVQADLPLVDCVRRDSHCVTVERRIALDRDLYLAHHHVAGGPVLPGAFVAELLAEATTACVGGVVRELRGLMLETPVRVGTEAAPLVQVRLGAATQVEGGVELAAEAASELLLRGASLQPLRPHARATLRTGAPAPRIDAVDLMVPIPAGATRGSIYEGATGRVLLGARFLPILWCVRESEAIHGALRAPDESDLFSATAAPRLQLDPLLLDGALQLAANWDLAWWCVPVGIESLRIHARRGGGAVVCVAVRVRAVVGDDVSYDLEVRTAGGATLMDAAGVRLRRVERRESP